MTVGADETPSDCDLSGGEPWQRGHDFCVAGGSMGRAGSIEGVSSGTGLLKTNINWVGAVASVAPSAGSTRNERVVR